MKIFISDLHLGDGSVTEDFHRENELLEFLTFVEREAQELIILGDFLELWQADLDKVLFYHSYVLNKLLSLRDKIKVTYVIGNHDYIPFIKFISPELGVCIEYRDNQNRIVGEHGHRYDIFNRYKNPLRSIKWPRGRTLTLFVASLERFIHPNVDVWTKKTMQNLDDFLQNAIRLRNKVTPTSKEYLRRGGHFGEFEEAVKNHINLGAKVVVFGHTHRAQLQSVGAGIYANCGAWVDGANPTYVAYQNDCIELREALTHRTIQKLRFEEEQ